MAAARSLLSSIVELLKNPRIAWFCSIALIVLTYHVVTYSSRSEKSAIAQRYQQWWTYLHQRQFSRAYALMAPQYRAEFTEDEFYRTFYQAGDEWLRPHSGLHVDAYRLRATIFPRDSFSDGNGGPEYEMLMINGKWYLTGSFKYVYGSRNHLLASN